ncbi:hypothetical protein [Mobiluncus mulieris]|uniref:hypothetical protein n=1 Tax=Mobiluncus mulieris TaxID=2052 RepID=UPI00242CDEFB|nr:hypothetical protein [Mobiluncus mulieris]
MVGIGEVINRINISPESVLINGARIHITGQTTIGNGIVGTAKIAYIDAGKITTGSTQNKRAGHHPGSRPIFSL